MLHSGAQAHGGPTTSTQGMSAAETARPAAAARAPATDGLYSSPSAGTGPKLPPNQRAGCRAGSSAHVSRARTMALMAVPLCPRAMLMSLGTCMNFSPSLRKAGRRPAGQLWSGCCGPRTPPPPPLAGGRTQAVARLVRPGEEATLMWGRPGWKQGGGHSSLHRPSGQLEQGEREGAGERGREEEEDEGEGRTEGKRGKVRGERREGAQGRG